MHILITGAAGMIGRKLTERLVEGPRAQRQADRQADAARHRRAGRPAGFSDTSKCATGDLADPAIAEKASRAAGVIFHLAGVVSGEAELDFDKGYQVNLDGTRALLEAIREAGDGYKPRVVYTSSIAVFGAPFPPAIPDDFHLTPLTSYGTQKAICEPSSPTTRGAASSRASASACRSIVVRPGKPNKAASGFFSGIIREPLPARRRAAGRRDRAPHPCEPAFGGGLPHARRGACRATRSAARQPDNAGRVLHGRRADRGAAANRRRQGRGAHPPRAGPLIMRIVAGWPRRLRPSARWRSASRPKSFDEIIRAHIDEEHGGTFVVIEG